MRILSLLSIAALSALSFSSREARADCNNYSQCLQEWNSGPGVGILAGGNLYGLYAQGVTGGVYAQATGSTGIGVQGIASSGQGVRGTATSGAAIRGESSASGGVAGHFSANPSGGTAIVAECSGGTAMWIVGNTHLNGNVFHTGSVAPWSDARLKKDIKDLPYGLDQAVKLHPVTYKMKEGDDRSRLGLIAQDVQKIVPEAVITDPKSGMLGLDYVALLPVMINALQEQQKVIRSQEARIAALEHPQSPKLSSILGGGALLGIGLLPLGLVLGFRRKGTRRNAPAGRTD